LPFGADEFAHLDDEGDDAADQGVVLCGGEEEADGDGGLGSRLLGRGQPRSKGEEAGDGDTYQPQCGQTGEASQTMPTRGDDTTRTAGKAKSLRVCVLLRHFKDDHSIEMPPRL
ncbi:MAG: hypothetical protein RMK49_22090, partial [Abditibacteriales bacterium]|nr:hypothetical protein [Abditibacteriales bacterium]